jgi:hypothetical protein
MNDRELTLEEAMQGLAELFSQGPDAPKRRYRKYLLEYQDGKPVFRNDELDSEVDLARDAIELAFDEVVNEMFGEDIVPQKLATLFPGSRFPATSIRHTS